MTYERRPIPNHDGYFADTDGQIWSSWRRWGKGYPLKKRKTFPDRDGYLSVILRSDKGSLNKHVAPLVLSAFAGTKTEGQVCRHLDGTRTNNQPSNLRWGTPAQNTADAVAHGTHIRGERCHKAKLTAEDVGVIRRERANGVALKVLANRFNVGLTAISDIACRKTWKHLLT